ncbi:MAG: MobF family relaxase, partial [Waterburya sp.]
GQIEITSKGKTQKISVARLLHSDYSYVDTVYSSQGQTADYCIYSAASAICEAVSFRKSKTIGRESFYVAASRAKQEFVVYTKNAVDLGVTIQLSRKNENAHELVQSTDSPKNQEKSQELDRQQTTKSKSELTNQLSQLNDAELINSLNRLSQWQKESPKKPDGHYGQNKHQRIERFKQEKARLGKQLRLQELELEKLGKPRSLLNPFGVGADVIEDKQIEIGRTRSGIYSLESQLKYVLSDFQQWQKQARAYLAWDEEKSTKQMRQLEKDFSAPQIRARVEHLKDVYTIYAAASYIVAQLGTDSFKGRYYQGKSYRIEQQDQKVTITHRDRDELLMLATDCRSRGGIIQVSQFNLTREDKNIIRDSARDLKQQIDRLQKSRQIERGGLSY